MAAAGDAPPTNDQKIRALNTSATVRASERARAAGPPPNASEKRASDILLIIASVGRSVGRSPVCPDIDHHHRIGRGNALTLLLEQIASAPCPPRRREFVAGCCMLFDASPLSFGLYYNPPPFRLSFSILPLSVAVCVCVCVCVSKDRERNNKFSFPLPSLPSPSV